MFEFAIWTGIYVIYTILSRVFTALLIGFNRGDNLYISKRKDFDSESDINITMFIPVYGEVMLAVELYSITVYHALRYAAHAGQKLRYSFNEKSDKLRKAKEQREKYLSKLSAVGLTAKDVPKYIKDPKALDEYLTIWKKQLE